MLDNPSAMDYPQKIVSPGVRWVMPGWHFAQVTGGAALANGEIVYVPIFVESQTTYIRIAVAVNVPAVGGLVRLGIFAWLNGLPRAQILDAGTVDIGAGGIKEIIIALTLARGYYFIAYRADAAAAGGQLNQPDINLAVQTPVSGINSTAGQALYGVCMSCIAAWADPAPAPAIYNSANRGQVWLREN